MGYKLQVSIRIKDGIIGRGGTHDCARCCWRWLQLFYSRNRTCVESTPWDCYLASQRGCVAHKGVVDRVGVGNIEPEVVHVKLLFCCLGDCLVQLVCPLCESPNSHCQWQQGYYYQMMKMVVVMMMMQMGLRRQQQQQQQQDQLQKKGVEEVIGFGCCWCWCWWCQCQCSCCFANYCKRKRRMELMRKEVFGLCDFRTQKIAASGSERWNRKWLDGFIWK